jgi:hypothetical protein
MKMAKFGAAALIRRKLRRDAVETGRSYLHKSSGTHLKTASGDAAAAPVAASTVAEAA